MIPFGFVYGAMKRNQKVSYDDDGDLIFRALADRSRRELLDRLRRKAGPSLNELCQGLDMTRPAVAKHLRILEEANLVAVQWRGREKLHFLNPVPINNITERWIGKFERPRLRSLSDLKDLLEASVAMPTSQATDPAKKRK
jgi:DNA-binding transcriptional ArsR family regulator